MSSGLFGTLILWAISAAILHVAVSLTGRVADQKGTYFNAFATTAVLSFAGWFFAWVDVWILSLLWPVAWLFVLKSMYGIGWLRAILIWVVLVGVMVLLSMFVLVPLGLVGAGFALLAA
jgi:hypothetical protein